jgi:ketopantoate reductase
MRFLIMGAGAVGSLLGAQLHVAGHEVRFWVRPALRAPRKQLVVQRVGGAPLQIETAFIGPGDVAPDSDWVLVCVRSEQLDAALAQVVRELGAARNVAISAVSFDNLLTRARRHGLTGCVLAHGISFGVWRDASEPARFHWFPFATPSMLSAEGEPDSLRPARELAAVLQQAGSPTRVMLSARAFTTWMVAVSAPLIAGWDVCGFVLERLAREPVQRRLTARAIAESTRALRLSGLWSLLTWVPAWAYALLLRALPWMIGRDGREVWLHHGPKIRDQTRHTLQIAMANAAERGTPAPALRTLAERFEQHVSLQ